MTNAVDGSTRLSLFCQINSISVTELASALEHIRTAHRDPDDEDYIYNLVITEIGFETGSLRTDALEVLMPYLPGGDRQSFDNVFVGSGVLAWRGAGNPYREGILNSSFRWHNLGLQRRLWLAFDHMFGGRTDYHFYISYEGVLSYFDEFLVAKAYEAYLIQSVRDAHDLRPDRSVMWAPAVWRTDGMTHGELKSIERTFKTVESYARAHGHDHGVNWLHLQDMLGRGWGGIDLADVRTWYRQLASLGLFDSLRVDTELFTPSYQPIPADVYRARMDYYDRNSIPVGASWELRYWYRQHTEIE